MFEFYAEFDSNNLRIQLSILAESYYSFRQGEVGDTFHNVDDFLKMNKKIWSLIPEVMSVVKIILVMPATNASSECASSTLRKQGIEWQVKMQEGERERNKKKTPKKNSSIILA